MMGGFILAPDGTPMHASRNNVIDPLEVLDKFGADAIRYYAATCALGKDNAFRWKDVTEGVRFTRKLWNVEKLMNINIANLHKGDLEISNFTKNLHDIDKWILTRYSSIVKDATEYMDNFQFDKARKIVVEFIRHELADHYMELVKHRIYNPDDKIIDSILHHIGFGIIKLIAPLLPHITEEIYQSYYKRLIEKHCIHLTTGPKPIFEDFDGVTNGELIKDIIRSIRHWKSEQGVPLNAELNYVGIISDNYRKILNKNKDDIISTIKIKTFEFVDNAETELKVKAVKPIYSVMGPEFKKSSKNIISKLTQIDPNKVYEQLKANGVFKLELDSGEIIKLRDNHLSIETTKQVHGREVETLDFENDITILIEK
jgi:valyl-tRNA synthetase